MLRFLEINIIFKIYPMDSKGQDGEALKTFPREFGIPDHLIFDGFQEQCGKETESMKQNWKNDNTYHRNKYHN